MPYVYISKLSRQNIIRLFTGFLEIFFEQAKFDLTFYCLFGGKNENFSIFCQKDTPFYPKKSGVIFLCWVEKTISGESLSSISARHIKSQPYHNIS
jgi:hypothetical protein